MKLSRQKLSKYYAEVTSTPGMLLISAHILDRFWKLRSFRKWDEGMDINPEDSVSNSSKLAVRLRVQVGTEQEPLQRVLPHQKTEPHRTHGFFAGSTFSQTLNFAYN